MEEKKLKRKGSIARTKEGEVALVNEKKQGFRVDEMVVVIWDLSDGRSEHEIVDEVASKSKVEKGKIASAIFNIISELKRAKLVE